MEIRNNHRTKILITVDTEFSIGGHFKNKRLKPVPADRHVYCKIDGKDYGINLIMDILEKYDHKGVFFVETESRFYFGEQEIISIIRQIRSRGHEVQLHIHPNYDSFIREQKVTDDMRRYSVKEQREIIKDALTFLSSHGIEDILAYRSGGFYSNLSTIEAIQYNKIRYSSNYNLAYRNCNYINTYPQKNDIFRVKGVLEVPITCYQECPIRKQWNNFQISAASYEEVKEALCHYNRQRVEVVTFITHSFEFVQPHDIQFSKITPRHLLIKRFEAICRYLAKDSAKYQVLTYRELDNLIKDNKIHISKTPINFYKSPFLKTIRRYFENYVLSRWNL